ncbi:MAG: hypothetical protein GF311_23460 [Candidatus Lokiarchaeota archaeon]|nr:hypothetical protein [Candidatus Lokiarchaeota archaeon]
MSPLFTGFPALIYSGLWTLKKFGILEREIPNSTVLFLITDAPPAFQAIIKDGDFEMERIEDIKNKEDLEDIQAEMAISLPSYYLLGGTDGFIRGMSEGAITIKNNNVLTILGKIASVF